MPKISVMLSTNSLFCPLAATQIEIDTDGSIRPCCNFDGSFGNVKDSKKNEIFHSKAAEELRNNLAVGIKDKRCHFCWKLEEKKITSKRQQSLKIFEHYGIDSNQNKNRTQQTYVLRSLDLKQSNLCNLKCRTCTPYSSSKWVEEYVDHHFQKFGNEDVKDDSRFKEAQIRWFDETFWLNQKSDLQHVEKVDFYGGEPLLDPFHKPFLKYLIDIQISQNISLVYGSNGSLLSDDFFEIWKNFKRVRFQVSQDGVEKGFEYLRYPAKWSRQKEVLDKLKQQNQVQFGVTLTYSSLNLMHLPEAFLWLYQNKIDFVINPVEHPAKYNIGHLPAKSKKIISNYYNQLVVMHAWMKPYLNEIVSFMYQLQPSDDFFYQELLLGIKHADAWRKQSLKEGLPMTYELFESDLNGNC